MDIKGFFTKIVKYIVTTLLGTITDTVVLWCLAHYVFGDSHFEQYIVSPCISFECAVFVNYLTAYFYVWKDRINRKKSGVFFGHSLLHFRFHTQNADSQRCGRCLQVGPGYL